MKIKQGCVLALSLALASVATAAVKGKTMFCYPAYDAAFWPKNLPVSKENYYKIYLDAQKLGERPFDTLVMQQAIGFGAVAGFVPSSLYPKHQPQAESAWMRPYKNGLPECAQKGIDPIELTVKWCRDHKKEVVISLPVNFQCVHTFPIDPKNKARSLSNGWFGYLFSEFQKKNPKYLTNPDGKTACSFGSNRGRDMAGGACDFAQLKVREQFVKNATEVVGKYAIDGLMIDFGAAPILFGSVATGGTAAPKECELITQMLKTIQASCAAKGVTLMVRVPDSVTYCKEIGIDLQGLLDQKIPGYVMLGSLFQLNRWNAVGDLVKKAGIPYGVCFFQSGITVFNDSGYSGDDERISRNSAEACRARIADALLCKADSCMVIMGTHWDVQMYPNCLTPFDAKFNRTANKRYFVSYTDDRLANSFLKDGRKHRTLPSLISNEPVDLSKGSSKQTIFVWDDFEALKRDGIKYETVLVTEIAIPSGIETIVNFNGKEYKPFMKQAGTQRYKLPAGVVKTGANEILIKSKGKNKRGGTATLGNIAMEVTFPKQ